MTASQALAEARRRDVDHRRQRVRQALAEMRAQAAEITISSVAARARVHRSFIHRHPDLRAAVIAAAEDPAASSPAGASHRQPPLAAGRQRQPARTQPPPRTPRPRHSKQRLSELLGTQISQRTGLGAPADVSRPPRTGRQPPPADPRPAQDTRRTRRGTRRRPGSQPAADGRAQPPLKPARSPPIPASTSARHLSRTHHSHQMPPDQQKHRTFKITSPRETPIRVSLARA